MKILNRAKTHFMKKSESGTYNVVFGKVKDVHALINDILDGESNKVADSSNVNNIEQASNTATDSK